MSDQTLIYLIADYFKTKLVLRARLFGSFARDEATPESDAGVLVGFYHNSPIGVSLPFTIESVNHDKKLIYAKMR